MGAQPKKAKSFLEKTVVFFSGLAISFALFAKEPTKVYADSQSDIPSISEYLSRPSKAGSLHVEGTALKSENGEEIVLQGASLHGLCYFPKFVNEGLFDYVSQSWNTNLIRLPVYSALYSNGKKGESLKLAEKGIDYASYANMYALIDWHVLEDKDPNQNLSSAIEFFQAISSEYANYPNVIYEICNEPNGDTSWEDIKKYANTIIPLIRDNDPDSLIIVGTPNYDRDLQSPTNDPLSFKNIMYSFHFYASSHGEEMQKELTTALDAKTPIFISECGISQESGNGSINYPQAKSWFSLLHERKLSYAVWSLSNKEETSAMIKSTSAKIGALEESDLSACGRWVRAMFLDEDVDAAIANISTWEAFYEELKENRGLCWGVFAGIAFAYLFLIAIISAIVVKLRKRRKRTYDELIRQSGGYHEQIKKERLFLAGKIFLLLSSFLTLIYLLWRLFFSIPLAYGWLAIICNILLLVVEVFGFVESLVHYYGLLHLREHPLPKIKVEEYPDVDLFISTYNEPVELLRKTIVGCKQIEYPDKNKVHIYLCDDNRREEMKELAAKLGINYFDRPDNVGAKAGNLNHALSLTHSPYVITFDADMIPRREFLLKTIPYFVDAEKRNASLKEKMPLGFIQTPQSFYNPDVFQYNLYNEKHIPNEQDFFYRSVEPAKTYSNSVIYGGSNTIISRKALEDIGGFYTKSITEDFATGLLIESAGYVSLGLSEPLASGMAPNSFKDHIQQRIRWGRGVIRTGRQLHYIFSKKLTFAQKSSYWSSVVYWYSPLKNLIYLLSPLFYALFNIPVFDCTVIDALIFWLPMFVFQSITIRLLSTDTMSSKWSGIQQTVMVPSLLIPTIKEFFGISLSAFKVTDKSKKEKNDKFSFKSLLPFVVLIVASLFAIIKRCVDLFAKKEFGLIIILFWLIRNLYFLSMGLFLTLGRKNNDGSVHVYDAESVQINHEIAGVTTQLSENEIDIYLDQCQTLKTNETIMVTLASDHYSVTLKCEVLSSKKIGQLYHLGIVDYCENKDEYFQLLYDRIPSLPQHYYKELGLLPDFWRNLTYRLICRPKNR